MLEDQKFTLTEEHVKLARAFIVGYQHDVEFGAPEIDPKRPYGNSDVYGDIYEIISDGDVWDQEIEMPAEMKQDFLELHESMETALQVILAAGSFEPGEYTAPAYSARWERVIPEPVGDTARSDGGQDD